MLTNTHGHVARALLLCSGWSLADAQIVGVAGIAVDVCTPAFIGEGHLAKHPKLGMPHPTQCDVSIEQAGSSWYPGWQVLDRWHGGHCYASEHGPIQLGGRDCAVEAAVERADAWLRTLGSLIRLGMEIHAALDTATHAGFYPCWHPKNRKASGIERIIPPILHAQYGVEPDRIEGVGRGITGGRIVRAKTRGKVLQELRQLQPILHREGADDRDFETLLEIVRTAKDDDGLCDVCDMLSCRIAERTLDPMRCWPRGSPEWREFFQIARGE